MEKANSHLARSDPAPSRTKPVVTGLASTNGLGGWNGPFGTVLELKRNVVSTRRRRRWGAYRGGLENSKRHSRCSRSRCTRRVISLSVTTSWQGQPRPSHGSISPECERVQLTSQFVGAVAWKIAVASRDKVA